MEDILMSDTTINIIQNCIDKFDSLYLEIGSSFEQLNNELKDFYDFLDSKVRVIYIEDSKVIPGGVEIVDVESSNITDSDDTAKIYFEKEGKVEASFVKINLQNSKLSYYHICYKNGNLTCSPDNKYDSKPSILDEDTLNYCRSKFIYRRTLFREARDKYLATIESKYRRIY